MAMKPSPLTLHYEFQSDFTSTRYLYFDLFKDISATSRRFNRQGQELAISGIRFVGNKTLDVELATLPNTWCTYQAWEATFRAWQRQNRIAQESNPDGPANAKYRDFKVYFDNAHMLHNTETEVEVMWPVGVYAGVGASATTYEWEYSELVFPKDTDLDDPYRLFMIGDNDITNYGLGVIHNYALSRSRPQPSEPNVPVNDLGVWGAGYLQMMFDTGEQYAEVMDRAINDNDEPPYPVGDWPEDPGTGLPTGEFYPGGANYLGGVIHHVEQSICIYNNRDGDIRANGYMSSFTAPLGMLCLIMNAPVGTGEQPFDYDIFIDLMPGPSQGVMARSMLEAN